MRKLQPVSFNLNDEEESKLYKHAMSHKYYSRYIKKLIAEDIDGGKIVEMPTPIIEEVPIKSAAKVVKSDEIEDVMAFF